MRIDTHAHIYAGDEATYPMKEDPYRPVAGVGDIEHLRREAASNGIDREIGRAHV